MQALVASGSHRSLATVGLFSLQANNCQFIFVYTIERNKRDITLVGPVFAAPIALATRILKSVPRSILTKPLTAKWLLVIIHTCRYKGHK